MFLATTNKLRRFVHVNFIGKVRVEEIQEGVASIPQLLDDMPTGFTLIMDLERMDSMGKECAKEIGNLMELFDQRGIGKVIRVIPDKAKDIGFQILYLLHYAHHPPVQICESLRQIDEKDF
jgi:hypothetical protein